LHIAFLMFINSQLFDVINNNAPRRHRSFLLHKNPKHGSLFNRFSQVNTENELKTNNEVHSLFSSNIDNNPVVVQKKILVKKEMPKQRIKAQQRNENVFFGEIEENDSRNSKE